MARLTGPLTASLAARELQLEQHPEIIFFYRTDRVVHSMLIKKNFVSLKTKAARAGSLLGMLTHRQCDQVHQRRRSERQLISGVSFGHLEALPDRCCGRA